MTRRIVYISAPDSEPYRRMALAILADRMGFAPVLPVPGVYSEHLLELAMQRPGSVLWPLAESEPVSWCAQVAADIARSRGVAFVGSRAMNPELWTWEALERKFREHGLEDLWSKK